jgi:hypothetical protein
VALELKLPIRDRAEVIDVDAVTDLPAYVEAGEERELVRELLVLLRQAAHPGALHARHG